MPNGTYGGVRGTETKVGQRTFVSRPTRFEFDITNSCHLQLAFLEFYPFKEVKYVKSLSFTEFTPTLFYLLSHKLLILNNLQIRWLFRLDFDHHP